MAFCESNHCRQIARVAVVSGPRYISCRCGSCAVAAARQLISAGRTVRIDPLVPTRVNANVASDGSYFASDVDCMAYQATLDRKAIDFAGRVDGQARRTSEAPGAGESVA